MGLFGCMDGSTICDSLVGVDALVGLLAIEEVIHNNMGNTDGTADEDDLVDVGLVYLGVTRDLLDRLGGAVEEVLAKLLETGTSEGRYPQKESGS